MGFLDSVKSLFSAGGNSHNGDEHWIYVRCRRCGEGIKTRIDLRNNLQALDDESGYVVRKTLVGSNLCFERIEVTLTYDRNRRVIGQEAERGEVITSEEFEALS